MRQAADSQVTCQERCPAGISLRTEHRKRNKRCEQSNWHPHPMPVVDGNAETGNDTGG